MRRKTIDKPRARRLFDSYLEAYNAAVRERGLPEVKELYTVGDLVNGKISSISTDDLYRDFMEGLIDDIWSDAEIGHRSRVGAAKGQRTTYGSPEQKARRRGLYQAEVDRLRTSHPRWSSTQVFAEAGKTFTVSGKTISRHTKDLGPQKKSRQ